MQFILNLDITHVQGNLKMEFLNTTIFHDFLALPIHQIKNAVSNMISFALHNLMTRMYLCNNASLSSSQSISSVKANNAYTIEIKNYFVEWISLLACYSPHNFEGWAENSI